MNGLIERIWNAPRNLLRRLRLVDQYETVTNELRTLSRDLKYEATAELSFSIHDFTRTTRKLKADLLELSSNTESRLRQLEDQQLESKNLIVQLTTNLGGLRGSTDSRLNQLENQQFESKNLIIHLTTNLDARLNTFENELLPAINNEVHGSIAIGLDIRARLSAPQGTEVQVPGERYEPAKSVPRDYLAGAQQEFPQAYGFWRERLEAMRNAFRKTKIGNAAHASDTYSNIFRSFVQLYARGHVLDVGCGVFGIPYYLKSYPTELISGIDPLEPAEASVFELVQGVSEYLPWRDNAFSTVISATSLDHCLSLDRSLSEIRRVLQPNGRFLLWIGSNSGSARYEPSRLDFTPVDEFHLFHFDIAWFEPILEQWFEVVERIELRKTTFSHVFYCLTKKTGSDVGVNS